jgi:hypothetical protein
MLEIEGKHVLIGFTHNPMIVIVMLEIQAFT